MNYKQILIGVAIGLIVATGVGYLIARNTITSSTLGGVVGVGEVQTNTFWFVNGLYAGTSQQYAVTSAGALTAAGITDNGALTSTGNLTTGSKASVGVSGASSTLVVGTGVGNITGCIELGDNGTASTTVYVTAHGATLTATTTKPSVCQ